MQVFLRSVGWFACVTLLHCCCGCSFLIGLKLYYAEKNTSRLEPVCIVIQVQHFY